MRSGVATAWTAAILLAAIGCGETRHSVDAGSGAGSGSSGDDPLVTGLDFVQSGTRLLALGYAANEARIFRTFHDQELGFDCDFVPDAAGRAERCVPGQMVNVIYTDADCSEPAAWVERLGGRERPEPGEAVSGIPFSFSSDVSCPGDPPAHLAAYRAAERLAEEGTSAIPVLDVRHLRDGKCEPASFSGLVPPAIQRLTPLAEDELARGHRVSLNVGQALRLTRLLSDDGAQLSLGVTGSDGTACEFQPDGECVPEPIARQSLGDHPSPALDADCTVPAFTTPYPKACGTPAFGVQDEPTIVRALVELRTWFSWSLIVPVTEQVDYACTASEPNPDFEPPLAPGRDVTGTLPTATTLRRGSGPLFADWFSVGENELLPVKWDVRAGYFGETRPLSFVNEVGNPCSVQLADDGTLRCRFARDGDAVPDLATFPEVVAITF